MKRPALPWLALGLLACDPSPSGPPQRPSPDTRSLYGDPALVPTPEGERARRDLARAGDLESLLPLVDARVVVGHPQGRPEQVVVRGRLVDSRNAQAVRAEIETSVRAIFGPEAQLELLLEEAAAAPTKRPPLDPLLWLAFIGFGASAGVGLERERRRRRRV